MSESEIQVICDEYKSALNDLKVNSKPLINMLTMLAEENSKYASYIIKVIDDQIQKALPIHKLPLLYLIDSIIKNVKQPYMEHISNRLVNIFCGVFEKVDEKVRVLLYKLRQTWTDIFPNKHLYKLDLGIKSLDPAWPIIASPPIQNQSNIHVNPKFFPKNEKESVSTESTQENKGLLTKSNSYKDDISWQAAIAKKHESLKLQQEKLEMEIAQTKAKLLASQHPKLGLIKDDSLKSPNHFSSKNEVHNKAETVSRDPRLHRLQDVSAKQVEPDNLNNDQNQSAEDDKTNSAMDLNSNQNSLQLKKVVVSSASIIKTPPLSQLDTPAKLVKNNDKFEGIKKRKISSTSESPLPNTKRFSDKDERGNIDLFRNEGDLHKFEDSGKNGGTKNAKPNGLLSKSSLKLNIGRNKDVDHRDDIINSNNKFLPQPIELPIGNDEKPLAIISSQKRKSPFITKDSDYRQVMLSARTKRYSSSYEEDFYQKSNNSKSHMENVELIRTVLSNMSSAVQDHKVVDMEKQADILKSAAMLMESGKLTHHQHQELLKQLHQLFQLKKPITPTSPQAKNQFKYFNKSPQDHRYTNAPYKASSGEYKFNRKARAGSKSSTDMSPTISIPKPIGQAEKVLIDGKERDIHFHGVKGFIAMDDDLPHGISFKGVTHGIIVGDMREQIPCGSDKALYIDGKPHNFSLGAPSKELFIDGKPYEIRFGEALDILLDGRAHHIKLLGPPPDVKVDEDAYYHPVDFHDTLTRMRATSINGKIHSYHSILKDINCIHCKRLLEAALIKTQDATHTIEPVKDGSDLRKSESQIPDISPPPLPFMLMNSTPASAGLANSYIASQNIPQQQRSNNSSLYLPSQVLPSYYPSLGGNMGLPQPNSFPSQTYRMNPISCYPQSMYNTAYQYSTNQQYLQDHSNNPNARGIMMAQHNYGLQSQMMSHLPVYNSNIVSYAQPQFSSTQHFVTPSIQPKITTDSLNISNSSQVTTATAVVTTKAPVDLTQLLTNLVKSGIIVSSSNSTLPNRNENTNVDVSSPKDEGDIDTEEGEFSLYVPPLDFADMVELKSRHPGVINSLYNGIQCSSCGMRFTVDQTDKYSQHLDWHFRKNRREKDMAGKRGKGGATSSIYNRPWYYTIDDWVQLEEIGDFSESDKARSEIFESQQAKRDKASGKKDSIEAIQNILNMVAVCKPSSATHFNEYDTGAYRHAPPSVEGLPSSEVYDADINNFQSQPLPAVIDENLNIRPIAGENDICEVCHEPFEQYWDEDEEEWILKNAVCVIKTGKTYHPLCYEDAIAVTDIYDLKIRNKTVEDESPVEDKVEMENDNTLLLPTQKIKVETELVETEINESSLVSVKVENLDFKEIITSTSSTIEIKREVFEE